jgi:membrane protease YdiL (CAAX protease family)
LGLAALYLIVLVVAIMLAGVIERVLAGAGEGTSTLDPMPWLFTLAAVLVTHVVMVRLVDRRPWSDVALGRTAISTRRVLIGLASGALAVGVPCLILLAVGWLQVAPGVGGSIGKATVRLLVLLLPAALVEELMVRGYLLTVLADGFGKVAAVVTTSVLFALLHYSNPGATLSSLVVVALAGIWLGVVRLSTASLYAGWAAHVAWNFVLAGALHAAVSGQDMAVVAWRTIDAGPDWATGGAWGPEGGVAAALGLVLTTALLIARPPLHSNGTRLFARSARGELTT